jgi:hypothetical protein
MTFSRVLAGFRGNQSITRPGEVAVVDDIQDVLPVFGAPAVIIFLLRISFQIDKTTLAASQAGSRLFHNLSFLDIRINFTVPEFIFLYACNALSKLKDTLI